MTTHQTTQTCRQA